MINNVWSFYNGSGEKAGKDACKPGIQTGKPAATAVAALNSFAPSWQWGCELAVTMISEWQWEGSSGRGREEASTGGDQGHG